MKKSIGIFLGITFACATDLVLLQDEVNKAQRAYNKIYYSTYGRGTCGDKEAVWVRRFRLIAEKKLAEAKQKLKDACSLDAIK